jgi:hypothetical protein
MSTWIKTARPPRPNSVPPEHAAAASDQVPTLSSLGSHARERFGVRSNIARKARMDRVKVMCALSHMNRPTGRKVSSEDMERLNRKRNKFTREWIYCRQMKRKLLVTVMK